MPRRLRLDRAKGWKLRLGAVSVSRGPGRRWGNPFVFGKAGPLWRMATDNVGGKGFFEDMLVDPELRFAVGYPSDAGIRAALRERDLACWCSLDQPCHADVLLRIANATAEGPGDAARPA